MTMLDAPMEDSKEMAWVIVNLLGLYIAVGDRGYRSGSMMCMWLSHEPGGRRGGALLLLVLVALTSFSWICGDDDDDDDVKEVCSLCEADGLSAKSTTTGGAGDSGRGDNGRLSRTPAWNGFRRRVAICGA